MYLSSKSQAGTRVAAVHTEKARIQTLDWPPVFRRLVMLYPENRYSGTKQYRANGYAATMSFHK